MQGHKIPALPGGEHKPPYAYNDLCVSYDASGTATRYIRALRHTGARTYVIDQSEADQGVTATGSGETIYDIAQTVGTSTTAVIKIVNDGNDAILDTDLDLSTYPNLYFDIEPGAQFDWTTSETLTFYSPENILASPRQQITAVDMIRFDTAGVVYPEWWGAVADGSTNSVTAFNNMISTVNQNTDDPRISVQLNSGTYVLPTAIDAVTGVRGVRFRGVSKHSTRISFTPTSADITLFTFGSSSDVQAPGWDVGDFTVFGGGNYERTYIKTIEWNTSVLSGVSLQAAGTDTDSIHLKLGGRDMVSVRDVEILAKGSGGKPIVFSKNGSGTPGIDHFNFHNILIDNNSALNPNIEAENDVDIQNLTFTGYNAWVGGNGAVKLVSTAAVTYLGIGFDGIRFEPGTGTRTLAQSNPTFDIELSHGSSVGTTGISWKNCQIAVPNISDPGSGNPTHIKLRQSSGVTVMGCNFLVSSGVTNTQWLDLDNTNNDFAGFSNTGNDGTGNQSLGSNMAIVFQSEPRATASPRVPDHIVVSAENATDLKWPGFRSTDTAVYNTVVEIADAGTVDLPYIQTDGYAIAQIIVACDKGSGTEEGGHFVVASDTTDGSAVKLSGSTNFVAGSPGASQAGVYKSDANTAIRIENDLGDSRKFSIMVFRSLD